MQKLFLYTTYTMQHNSNAFMKKSNGKKKYIYILLLDLLDSLNSA